MTGRPVANTHKLIVLGAGGHGKVVTDLALTAGYRILGFVDDQAVNAPLPGYVMLGRVADLARLLQEAPDARLIVAVGDNRMRMDLVGRCPDGDDIFPALVHPAAVISPFASLGPGTVALPGVVVNAGARIGRHVILNTGSTVDHDCQIGDFAHLSPGAHLAGNVSIQTGAQVGTGAAIIPDRIVGAWSVVGAGAAVIRDVPPGIVVAGVPARKIRGV